MVRGRGSVLGAVLLLAVACGGGEEDSSGSAPPTTAASATTAPPAATATSSARTAVPDVVVRDVATGADVNLRALGLPERPTLYWFWAPH
ncbi:MAG: hypothetical protein AB1679_19755 [Actinomycetota bacterium]|jgi:hypothetical protein